MLKAPAKTLVIGLLFTLTGYSQPLKKTDWNSDIEFLAKELPQKHYDLFNVKAKKSFLTGLEKIKSKSHNLTDFEIAVQLQQLIALFGDSHTRINYGQLVDKEKILPLQLYWFSDGLYVLYTTEENGAILGKQILAVNGIPLSTIADSLSTIITKDNEAIVQVGVPEVFPLVQMLEYYGFVKGNEIELTVKDLAGNTSTHLIKPAPMTRQNRKMYKPDSLALCHYNERIFFVDYFQMTDKIYYIQYNKCWSKELELQYGNARNAEGLPSFKEFEDRALAIVEKAPIEKLVIDLRFNGGGSSPQGTEFAEKISRLLKTNSKLKIYVIVGRNTFSSAILNAMDFKQLTQAIIVGEETAGKPNHFGEVKNFLLPGSGLRVDYSTKYFKRTNEKVSTLMPDVRQTTSFSDFKRGIDPVYGWIKSQ